MENRKCDYCSNIASKAVYSYKTDRYRIVCNTHAKEIVKNMRDDGYHIEAENLNKEK